MSKRNLYKPAPSQTPPRMTRRSLPQGRLVSTDPHSLFNNTTPKAKLSLSGESKPSPRKLDDVKATTPRARRSLDYTPSMSAAAASELHPQTSYPVSPTIMKSPPQVKPSSSLSLSEPEEEPKINLMDTKRTTVSNQPSVLVVDASERHVKDKEVPIKMSYVPSPAKVVCHSPHRPSPHSQSSRSIKGTCQYGHAGTITVPVESVPAVNVSQENVLMDNESKSSCSNVENEDGSVSTVAGSPVDPRSRAIETTVVRDRSNPRSYVSFLDEEESVTDTDVMRKPLKQSDLHVRQPKFDDTSLSSIAGDSTLSSIGEETKKKKRKPRVVQSKYMTSAMSRMGPKASTTRRPESRLSKTSSLTSKIKKSKSSLKSVPKELEKGLLDTDGGKGKATVVFTSTPAVVPHLDMTSMSADMPVITPAPSRATQFEDAPLLTPSLFTPPKEQPRRKKINVPQSKEAKTEHSGRPNKQTTSDINHLQLDLQNARWCQWRFLRSKFKHCFEKQENEAQEKIHCMWKLNEQLKETNRELRLQLETQRKLDEIDKQLELQESLLKPVDENADRLISDYNGLYEGIDTTRHHIPVKEILLPENEADLLAALELCENTLGKIALLLQHDESKVVSFSKEMEVLADTVMEEQKEHHKCTELLAAVSTLTTQERSLQAQLLQRNEQ